MLYNINKDNVPVDVFFRHQLTQVVLVQHWLLHIQTTILQALLGCQEHPKMSKKSLKTAEAVVL